MKLSAYIILLLCHFNIEENIANLTLQETVTLSTILNSNINS